MSANTLSFLSSSFELPRELSRSSAIMRTFLNPIVWIVLLSLLVIHHYQRTKFSRTAKLLKAFPTVPYNLPLIGHAYKCFTGERHITSVFDDLERKYGRECGMFSIWLFGKPHLIVLQPKFIKKILMSNSHIEKGSLYDLALEPIKNGLIISTGQKWRHDRKVFTPAFSRQLFDGFIQVFDKEALKLVKILGSKFKEDSKPKNLSSYVKSAALEMVFESSLGMDLNIQEKDNIYEKAITTLTKSNHLKIFLPFLYYVPFVYHLIGRGRDEKEAWNRLHSLSSMAIKRKQAEITDEAMREKNKCENTWKEQRKPKFKPFLDILVEEESKITEQEYTHHLLTIVGAGGETTANSVYLTLFMLAASPVHQAKCQQEIDGILGHDSQKALSLQDLTKAKYLEMCWKESMRLFPPIPGIARKIDHDVVLDDGRIIQKGVEFLIDIYHLHRNPEIFPEPEKYDPERFLPAMASTRPSASFIPFSMGIRNCIGLKYAHLEAMTMMIRILSQFTLQTDQSLQDIHMIVGLPGKSYNELCIRLIPRFRAES